MAAISPQPLTGHHALEDFESGVASLDDWLKKRARANQTSGASRTYVSCDGTKVIGYYALASGGVSIHAAPGKFRRNMPDPVPVVVLGRLAVDRSYQSKGIGRALFRDSAIRVMQAAEILGIRGILVHAISEEAKAFYLTLGFQSSPIDQMTLMIALSDVRQALE